MFYDDFYSNRYLREHSDNLRNHFDINRNGIDYHNLHNIAIEFKECFSEVYRQQFFKVPLVQVNLADFFIFCIKDEKYFVVNVNEIKNRYTFKNKYKLAYIRINTVMIMSIYQTDNINELKSFISNLM